MSCLVRNRKRNSGSTLDEFDKVSTQANADDTECESPEPDAEKEPDNNERNAQTVPDFGHLNETRRKIHDAIAALNDDSFDKCMARLLMQYEGAIREEFERAQYLPWKCRKLARILIGLTDVIHTMARGRALQQDEVYRQRMCHIVGFYISCELCSAQEPVESEETIINRINCCLKLHVEFGGGGAGVHREHVLRTLLAAPKLFNRASILSALYSRLFPHWSMPSIMIQAELPDKLYIEYILIFYYWQRLESDESVKERIVDFAEKFMRPSRSLATKSVYAHYLPKFADQNTATRTILNHLKTSRCFGLHMLSKVDNRPVQSNEVILSSDDDEGSCPMWDISGTPTSSLNNHPPVFLQNLCQNARQLEPCKRANALFSGIDNSIEIVELRDSDDDVEMFSVNFNVPANVDGIISNSNSNDSANQTSTTMLGEDDSVPVTRIYPSNLRTYERAVLPPTTYTVPRIVNSYSCRRDSLHLVSTTAPHLVDQCVQTLEDEEPDLVEEEDQYSSVHSQSFFPRRSSASDASGQRTPLYHCRQTSSQNSNCSESSLVKKQVTFSPRHLGATASVKATATKKPSIKQYKSHGMGIVRWKAEHLEASAKMFAKLDARIKARNEVVNVAASQLTPTTSNASSSTPTKISARPTRIRNKARGQRVALPTPPASTHSSSSPCQIQITTADNQNSNSEWDFGRRCFSKASGDEVSYYNHLLKVQRENIRRRRLNNQKKKTVKVNHQEQKDTKQLKLLKQATKRCRQLRALNAKQRKEVQQLEQDLTIIRKSAPHRLPLIRLKRFNLRSLVRSQKANEALSDQEEIVTDEELSLKEVEQPEKREDELKNSNDFEEKCHLEPQNQIDEREVIGDPDEPNGKEGELDPEHQEFLEEQFLQEQHQLEMLLQQQEEEEQQVDEEAEEVPHLEEGEGQAEEESDQAENEELTEEKQRQVEVEPQTEEEQSLSRDQDRAEENQHHDQQNQQHWDEQVQEEEVKKPSLDNQQIEEEVEPPLKHKKRKRRRRFKCPRWTHTKNKRKKWLMTCAVLFEADPVLETSPIQPEPAPDEEPPANAEPIPEPAYEFDQDMVPEVGNELEIAAPILAAEGEDSTAMLSPSHNLELVTINVPVYLLNGESRDVSTPLSSSSFGASGSEPYATSKD
ncbi:uncharacterized protein LOC108030660 [Drosophila biarmipes]|uniref:uncharacterized protein LOC108030660 n=1 Tax=Drosophila biarmipes TaxID=125945 RepID=UPI0007E78965|nr:uncharacterized protein LOC108030660 [Drosophila biarmipes]